MGRSTRTSLAAAVCLATVVLAVGRGTASPGGAPASPIQHVLVIYQENHSFDNVLGAFCQAGARCDGATQGSLPSGQQIPLSQAADLVANETHNSAAQLTAMNGGRMDGFSRIPSCKAPAYSCYTQYQPEQIPNLSALAGAFAVSDRTFQMDVVPSFGAHLELASATLDGFTGDNPAGGGGGGGRQFGKSAVGWGCDSRLDAQWIDPHSHRTETVPSCVPDRFGRGPYRRSPVSYVPTIMDRLDNADLSWKFYATNGTKGTNSGYTWAICPTFAECLFSQQARNVVRSDQVLQDAASGSLPNFAILLPNSATGQTSQHNNTSMAFGDNWIGQVVSAVENGPQWDSTAIFITYDDCGCFYDHVPPPPGLGIRVPMVIVSPYAKPASTDSNTATFASMLAFTEHTFGLEPLTAADATAYDYADSFNFGQHPLGGVPMVHTSVPRWELRWVGAHREIDDT